MIGHRRLKLPVPVGPAKCLARTVVPMVPGFLMPYKFNVAQVEMSQEDNVCDPGPAERAFGFRPRDFRAELAEYANHIPC
jgi:hypothetical protein